MSDTTQSDTFPVPHLDIITPETPVDIAQAATKNIANMHANLTVQAASSASPTNAEIEPVYQFTDIVSGQFDADEEAVDLTPPKRVLAPMPESPKLHKVLAQSGLGSRLEMEALILEGRISVNNEPAHIGQRVQWGDQVKVNGRLLKIRIDPPPARIIAYHKPTGEVVTHDDPQNRPTVFRRLPKLYQGKWQSVGRLDLNTEGLLLFTNSGELANRLMHPRFGLEREYAVRVLGALNKEEKQKLLDGVQLEDGFAQFGSIEEGGGEGSNHWYRVTISEGRNREVRRMVEAVGHAVSRLIRIRYGAMMLPRGLKRGAHMELDDTDIRALVNAAGGGQERAVRTDGASSGPERGNSPQAGQGEGPEGRQNRRTTRGPRNLRNGRRSQESVRANGQSSPNGPNVQNGPRGPRFAPQVTGQLPSGAEPNLGYPASRVAREPLDDDEDNHSQAGVSHENAFTRPQRGNRNGPRNAQPNAYPARGNNSNPNGAGNSAKRNPKPGQGAGGQPDPMRTSQGYIGADSLQRQRAAPSGGRGGRGAGGSGAKGRSGGR